MFHRSLKNGSSKFNGILKPESHLLQKPCTMAEKMPWHQSNSFLPLCTLQSYSPASDYRLSYTSLKLIAVYVLSLWRQELCLLLILLILVGSAWASRQPSMDEGKSKILYQKSKILDSTPNYLLATFLLANNLFIHLGRELQNFLIKASSETTWNRPFCR